MKIHSDILTKQNITEAKAQTNADLGLGIYFTTLDARGSRSRERGFEFRLAGNSRRHRNSGTHGAATWDDDSPASWDDHGHFFARVFLADPDAIIGRYDGDVDFHVQTDGLYTVAVKA